MGFTGDSEGIVLRDLWQDEVTSTQPSLVKSVDRVTYRRRKEKSPDKSYLINFLQRLH